MERRVDRALRQIERAVGTPPQLRNHFVLIRVSCALTRAAPAVSHTGRMRKQYHFRPGRNGLDAWDVDRLVDAANEAADEEVALAAVSEVDSEYWYDHGYRPTVRSVVEHCRLIQQVDLDHPIVLDPDGRVMDGMHRVAKALLQGHTTIKARRLAQLPPPDFVDCSPENLPY